MSSPRKRMDLLESWRMSVVLPHVRGTLLDVGCGYNNLVRAYGRGVGVDVRRWPGTDAQISDASALPFRDECFDTVSIIAALNHIPNREAALREAWRVIAPGGRLVVTMIGPATGRIAHLLFRHDEAVRGGMAKGEVQGIQRREMRRLVESSGFRILQERKFECGLNTLLVAEKREDLARAPRPTKLSVIIPVYNEQSTIRELVERVCAVALPGLQREVVIVDDGSDDLSSSIISDLECRRPDIVKVHTSLVNLGKGAAIRLGLEHVTGDIILIQDADLEMNPAEYPAMLAPILDGQADVVYGSRFHFPNRRVPPRTRLANRALTSLTNLLFGSCLTDMATAYKVFRGDVIRRLRLRSSGFEFEPEVTAKLLRSGYKIREVPVSYSPRSAVEGKKIGWLDGVHYVHTLLRCRLEASAGDRARATDGPQER